MTLWSAAYTLIGKSLNATCVCIIIVPLFAQGDAACRMNPNWPAAIRLAACRPNPVTPAEKAALRAALPPTGEVLVTGAHEVEKLSCITRTLHFFKRDAVYDVKVVDVPEAWAGLYGRAFLLISLPMFRLLDKEELAAIAAHEAGHEYVWGEFEDAQVRKDKARLRQLELTCDAIAAIALTRVGVATGRLLSGLERAFTYNLAHFGFSPNQESYPSLKERRMALGAGCSWKPEFTRQAGFRESSSASARSLENGAEISSLAREEDL